MLRTFQWTAVLVWGGLAALPAEAADDDYASSVAPVPLCHEPAEVAVPVGADDLAVSTPDFEGVDLEGIVDEEGILAFHPEGAPLTYSAKVLVPLTKERFERTFAGLDVRVAETATWTRGGVELLTRGRNMDELDLVVTYEITTKGSKSTLGARDLELIDRTTGATVDAAHHDDGMVLAAPPGSCEEAGLVRFGPLPHDMPPINFPEIDCHTGKCEDVAEGWVRLHHNVWRASQMFALMDGWHPQTRSFFWDRPGIDAGGSAVSIRTSPAYWFGDYDGDRYQAVRDVIGKFWTIVRTNKTGAITLRLKCPDPWSEPGNVCFNSSTLGHHWVKGYVNLCDATWWATPGCSEALDNVHEVLHHEPLHHVFTSINGPKALRDTITHGHGWGCLSGVTTKTVYCEESQGNMVGIRHFVEHGEGCWHHDKVVQTVDAYAQFIQAIGNLVYTGGMTHWPLPAPPTPHAPQCEDEVGCLCSVADWQDPDGDYLPNTYCDDSEGDTVCMTKTFNASQTVGICTLCDEHRGPGCACNDLWMPCEQGNCYGDDTNGTDSAVGTCFMDDNVPDFACLADCEALMGAGSVCLPHHPDGARCVPPGTSNAEAGTCWLYTGHMDPGTNECTAEEECIETSDCHDLGYPVYFACDASLRCVAMP